MEKPGENQSCKSQSSDDLVGGDQTPNNQPSLVPAAGQQTSSLPVSSLQLFLTAGQEVTTLSGAKYNVVPLGNNLSILQANGPCLPVVRTEGLQSLTSRGAGAKPTTSQARSLQPQIVRPAGHRTIAVGASVQTVGLQAPSPRGLQPPTIPIRPTGPHFTLLPQTDQPTVCQTPPTNTSVTQSYGRMPVSYGLIGPTASAKQVSINNASSSECVIYAYADGTYIKGTCIPKRQHNYTSTTNFNNSIGTQANIPLRHKSQGVQCGNSNLQTLQTLQESSTQEKRTARSSQDNNPSLLRSVTSAQGVEPAGYELPDHDLWQADNLLLQDLLRIQRHRYVSCEPGQVQFDDVAIYFSKDEWECLNEDDKDLYVEVMVKNYRTLHSLGWINVKPPLITMIERREDAYARYPKQFENPQIPGIIGKDFKSLKIVNSDENYNLHKFSEHLRKSIDDFLDSCMQQTKTSKAVMSKAMRQFSESRHFCQGNPLFAQNPATDEKPFRCFRCDKHFMRFSGLLAHQKCHPFENVFPCLQCSMTFKTIKNLLKHELIHTGEKPFICPKCGNRYSTQETLDDHLGVTFKKNRYVCSTCGKRFPKKQMLHKHELNHKEDEPYVCYYCGIGFMEKDNYNRHQRIHMQEIMITQN